MIDVLLVEDDAAQAFLIAEMLAESRRGKFQLQQAASLAEGLRKLALRSYDLILADLGLPDSRGIATVDGLRAAASQTPIVVLSALNDEHVALGAIQSGAQDYLVKGMFDPDALERVIFYALERNRIRQELRRSELKYRTLVEQSPDGIFVSDMEGRLLDVNKRGCEMLGYNLAELLARSVSDLFEPIEEAELRDRIADLRAGKTIHNERIIRRKDGTLLPVDMITRVADAQRMQAIVRDISDRKRAEETLREANQRALLEYRQLLNRIADLEQQLGTAHDLPGVFRGLLDFLLASLPCNALIVSLYAPERQERTCVYAWSEGQEEDISALPPLPMNSSPASRAVSTGEIVVTDAFESAAVGEAPVSPGLARHPRLPASSIAVPLIVMGGVIGAFEVQSVESAAYRQEHVTTVRMAANVAAVAIENVRLLETERHSRIEAEASEQRFRDLVQGLEAIVWERDLVNSQFTFVSQQAEVLLGYPIERWISEEDFWINHVHPDDLDLARLHKGASDTRGNFYALEYRMVAADGRTVFLRDNVRVLRDEQGQPLQLRGVVVDITERKRIEVALRESEQRYRAIMEQASDAIFIADPQRNYINVNEKACQLSGYSREELLCMSTNDIVVQDVPSRQELRPGMRAEVMLRRRDGVLVPVEATGGVLDDGRVLAIVRDISERKQAEQDRLDRLAAEAANEAKSEFLSHVSHELRTPLNAILGFSQLLEMGELSPEDRESAAYIAQAGRHLLGLINDVLDMARVEAGKLAISPEPVVIKDLLAECFELTAPAMSERKVRLVVNAAAPGDHAVLADRQRLKQVLLNLLSNAIKYNRPGGSVGVEYRREQGAIRVLICDTGPGLSPEKLARLFVAFDRLGAEAGGVEGTGLGLVISKQLIEAMGGRIGVESSPGAGSTFWLELPEAELEHADDIEGAGEGGHEGQSLDPAAAVDTRTMLYIEDNPASLSLVQKIVERRPNIRLLSAHSGLGFELAQQHQIDLILLDLHLPDISGEEALLRLKADPRSRQIPVVILSADASAGTISRLLDSGAHDFLTKPLEVRRLLSILDELLSRHHDELPS